MDEQQAIVAVAKAAFSREAGALHGTSMSSSAAPARGRGAPGTGAQENLVRLHH